MASHRTTTRISSGPGRTVRFRGRVRALRGQVRGLGFTEIVIHAPVPDGSPEFLAAVADEKLFERNVTQGLDQLAGR